MSPNKRGKRSRGVDDTIHGVSKTITMLQRKNVQHVSESILRSLGIRTRPLEVLNETGVEGWRDRK